jgi:hypothetical protein
LPCPAATAYVTDGGTCSYDQPVRFVRDAEKRTPADTSRGAYTSARSPSPVVTIRTPRSAADSTPHEVRVSITDAHCADHSRDTPVSGSSPMTSVGTRRDACAPGPACSRISRHIAVDAGPVYVQ